MPFNFQCPQCANILQAEPAQAGQQCYCPICGTLFIIPAPIAQAAPAAPTFPAPGFPAPAFQAPSEPAAYGPSGPQVNYPPYPGPDASTEPAPFTPPPAPAPAFDLKAPEILHIPCPQCKQELETPVEMLDQDVLCPHCQAQFRLRRQDSEEYKRKKKMEQEIREHKTGSAWFNWAIVVVVLVVIFLLVLILSSQGE
jgi:DNA-directed RNA polymerase subunit M/transcription elongation factor TFIIS